MTRDKFFIENNRVPCRVIILDMAYAISQYLSDIPHLMVLSWTKKTFSNHINVCSQIYIFPYFLYYKYRIFDILPANFVISSPHNFLQLPDTSPW